MKTAAQYAVHLRDLIMEMRDNGIEFNGDDSEIRIGGDDGSYTVYFGYSDEERAQVYTRKPGVGWEIMQ